ncbi:MAG: CpaF family protein [Nitriliruptorales bacterium]
MSLYERLAQTREAELTTANGGGDGGETRAAPVASDPLAEVRRKTHQALLQALGPKLYESQIEPEVLEARVREKIGEFLAEETTPLSSAERKQLVSDTLDDILGYGPISPFLRDPTVTEVMVNGPTHVYIERDGKAQRTAAHFLDVAHLRRTIDKIVGQVGRRIDEAQPYVDARLADGSRVNAVIPPISVDGPALTIRKFSADPFQTDDLVSFGTMTGSLSAFLQQCVAGRINILVSGGTGAGKTTTLNVLSSYIPDGERIVTIEDAAELKMQQPHVVRMEARPPNIEGRGQITIRDLVRNSLRMRPDRIVVGEVRGGEALDMLQAMNTGHDGSISTIHANSPRDVLSRLETMVLMAGMDLPIRAIREQVASAIQLLVHQARLQDGTRRITHVTEVLGMEGDIITSQDLFVFDFGMGLDESGRVRGHLKATGIRPTFADRLANLGHRLDPALFARETDGARR